MGAGNQAPQPQNVRGPWTDSEAHLRAGSVHARGSSNTSASAWGASPVLWQNAGGQTAVPTSPFSSSMAFSGDSSLPAVNSPWGVPMAAHRPGPTAPVTSSTSTARLTSYAQSYAQMGSAQGDESSFGLTSTYGQYNTPSQVDRGYATHPSPALGSHVSRAEHIGRQVLMDPWSNDMGPRSSNFTTADDRNAPLGPRAGNQPSPTFRGGQAANRVNPAPSVGRLNWDVKAKPN